MGQHAGHDRPRRTLASLSDAPAPAGMVEHLGAHEQVLAVARPLSFATAHGLHWQTPHAVVTGERLLLGRVRRFANTRVDFAIGWGDVDRIDAAVWGGDEPAIQLVLCASTAGQLELLEHPIEAVELEAVIRAAWGACRRESGPGLR